ncbi:MAG TPA: ABC transporter permease subunit [Terriglobales bacterium]|nr:ABC transporter permease subunit [Terriglobales bacterium]
MEAKGRTPAVSLSASVREVFGFFFSLGRRTGKTRVFVLLGGIPVVIAVLVRILAAGRADDLAAVFSEILIVFYVTFYIVILSLFYGTSIVAEELEGRTLPYLTSRPLSKAGIFLGKYAAYTTLTFLMVAASLALSYFIMNGHRLADAGLYLTYLKYAAVLGLGLLAYTAFFAFLGTFLKRAILLGLMFGFGWENVIQYFPGSTQKFSLVHYLKSLLPRQPAAGGKFSLLLFRLEPTGPAAAVASLVLIAAVFVVLGCWIFRTKEYLFEE